MADQLPHGLDPKFQSVYDRVMGTPTAAGGNPPTPVPAQPVPVAPQPATATAPTPPQYTPTQQPKADQPLAETVVIPQVATKQDPTPLGSSDTFSQGFVAGGDKKKGVSPVIMGLGVIVFFVVYTLFWIKILNVQLPFLPQ